MGDFRRDARAGLVLAGLVILCAGRRAEAAPIRPPPDLIEEIRKTSGLDPGRVDGDRGEPGWDCEGAEVWLDWSRHLLLKDGRLLLLLEFHHCAIAGMMAVVPVTVDQRGRWRWRALLEGGTPAQFGMARDESIWIALQWSSEAGWVTLYRSSDAIAWKEVELPPERATSEGSMEELEALCLAGERVEIQIRGQPYEGGPVTQTWSHALAPEVDRWKLERRLSTRCAKPRPPTSACVFGKSTENEVLFHCRGRAIALPKSVRQEGKLETERGR